MKKVVLVLLLVSVSHVSVKAQSIDPVSLLISKLIRALELQVKKMQYATMVLQQAQQVAERGLSTIKMQEIADCQRKQQDLYAGYFKELRQVNQWVKNLKQAKQIGDLQATLEKAGSYLSAGSRQAYMQQLDKSRLLMQSLKQLLSSDQLVMKDADRLLYVQQLRTAMNDCVEEVERLQQAYLQGVALKESKQRDLRYLSSLIKQK